MKSKSLTYFFHFTPTTTQRYTNYFYAHVTGREIKAQRNVITYVTLSKGTHLLVVELRFEIILSGVRALYS